MKRLYKWLPYFPGNKRKAKIYTFRVDYSFLGISDLGLDECTDVETVRHLWDYAEEVVRRQSTRVRNGLPCN